MTPYPDVPLTLKTPVPIGPLSASLQKQIETDIAAVMPDGKSVVILGVADQDGWKFGAAMRMGDGWRLTADAGTTWGGQVQGRVQVLYAF